MKILALKKELLLWFLLSAIAYLTIAYSIHRSDFLLLLFLFSVLFLGMYRFYRLYEEEKMGLYFGLAVFYRLLFFFAIPSLSDDFYRFIWDGQVLLNGQNPFQFLPSENMLDFSNNAILLEKMNSPNYYSVYPPVAQGLYVFGVALFPQSILGAICSMRFILLLAELLTLYLLPKALDLFAVSQKKALLYFFNPLIVIECIGNLHQEALLICFLLLGLIYLKKRRYLLSGTFWALSAASKLIPLLLLPFLFRYLKIKRWMMYVAFTFLFFGLLWWPFFEPYTLTNIQSSLNLYFQSFEFNASIYYVIRAIGTAVLGYNPIKTVGLYLPKIILLLVILIAVRPSNKIFMKSLEAMLLGLSIYYFGASILHPWYICTILFLGLFSNYSYPVIWSGLVLLSYHAYQNVDYHENMLILIIEYTILFLAIAKDLFKSKSFFKFEQKN